MKYTTDRILHQSILAVTNQATYERIIQVVATRLLNDTNKEITQLVRDFGSMTTDDRANQLAFIKSNLAAVASLNIQSLVILEGE